MPYTSKQKALLLPMLEKLQAPNFRQDFALVAQSDFFKKNDPGVVEFQKNLELLHRYKEQLQKKQPTELTEEQFRKVWASVQKYCGSALPELQKKITEVDQNSEERTMIQVCINCVGDYKDFFEKVDAQEKKYDQMPHQEPVVAPAAEPVPFSSDEAVPYFAALDQRNVLDKMDDLAEDAKLSPEKARQVQEYRNAVAMLTHYAREKSQGHPVDPATEQLAKEAWNYIRDHSRQIEQDLGRDLASADVGGEKYAAVQSFLGAVNACRVAVTQVESREILRRHMVQDVLLGRKVQQVQKELLAYDADHRVEKMVGSEFEWDDDEIDADPEVDQMREELSGFQWRMQKLDVTFDNDYAALDRRVKAIRQQLPAEVLERFRNVEGLEDFVHEIRELPIRLDWERRKMIDLTTRVDAKVADILGGDAASPEMKEDVRKKLQALFYQNGADAGKNAETINAYLDTCGISPESREKLKTLFAENTPQYAAVLNDIDVTMECMDRSQQLKELQVLEGQRAILAAGCVPGYVAEYNKYFERTYQTPEASFRQQLGMLAAQLNKMHKAGRNTEEYRRFREALNAAAKDGNLDALRQTAQAYCNAKTVGGKRPSSSWGLGRLGIAESVLGMLDDHQKLTAAPAKPLTRPEVPAPEKQPKPWIEDAKARELAKKQAEEEKEKEAKRLIEERKEQEKKKAEEEAKAREEQRKQQALEAEKKFLAANKPEPLNLSGEMEPEVPYEPLGNETLDGMRRNIEGWIADHFKRLPEEQANKITRKMCNIMTRHMTGKPDDLAGFLRDFDREFTDKKQWRPPLEQKDDVSMIRLSLSDMVVAYTVGKARNWLMKDGASEYEVKDLLNALRRGLYDAPAGVDSFEYALGGKPVGPLSHYSDAYLNLHIFVDDWNRAMKGKKFDNAAPWDAPAAEVDEEYPNAAEENFDAVENPFDAMLPAVAPFAGDPFHLTGNENDASHTYKSLTLEHFQKVRDAQLRLSRLKLHMSAEQQAAAGDFFEALGEKIGFIHTKEDLAIHQAVADLDPVALQQAITAYHADKDILRAILPPQEKKLPDGMDGREKMQQQANEKIREKLSQLPQPVSEGEKEFNAQLEAILKKGNEVDNIRALLMKMAPQVLQEFRRHHQLGSDVEKQMHKAMKHEPVPQEKEKSGPKTEEVGKSKGMT